MKYLAIILVAFLALYGIYDIAISVIGFKQSQIGYNPQQIAFMNELVEDAQ